MLSQISDGIPRNEKLREIKVLYNQNRAETSHIQQEYLSTLVLTAVKIKKCDKE